MRHCLALDLKNDPELISQYRAHHREVWPEIKQSIASAGITDMDIYLVGNRLFMIMETGTDFDAAAKARADRDSEAVQKWETLMWTYQQALPTAKPGEKWLPMDHIFSLGD